MMNPVPWLQMTNMISYQGLVRTFPNYLCEYVLNSATGDTLHNGRHSHNGASGGRSDRALRADSTAPPARGLAAF
ncbi:hypothetical protein C0073_017575 [Aeromonas veronii]|nr:hypothetical protein C0073_017575 [Aeromonas veronii]